MPDAFGLAAIIAKFALYLGLMTAAGTVMATCMFRLDRTRGLAAAFAVVGLMATILAFSLRGANLTGNVSGMTDPEMLGLLWTTPVGTALLLRLVGLGLLIAGLFMGRLGMWISMLGGIIAIWSFDHIGHVSSRDTTLLEIALTLHLLAVALWIGVLTPLKRLASSPATYTSAADVGHRFGVVAMVTVPALIIAGGYMGYELAGSLEALVGTGYGQALIIKMLLVGLLLGLAAANKLRFIPALRAGDPAAAGHLSKSISVEWLVILAVLGTTAVLTTNLTLPT
ncbi:copper resistance D family protein [Sulfitobacter mediterraneus]|uniref:Putative copper resistance protein D n=1 Tax=Sulfitobacter mediterraneus TaxID=83219 RepID=A0A2T6CG93_9RHOB|nr:CopD family protein [Sulfitobacter mediterraneus]KIN75861.1 Copper resistance D [Sulfitobacter mediterraneus KCTC 32188]PTX74521.1 putative copper resistance protein D [Sulfitobacter mediterraneus]